MKTLLKAIATGIALTAISAGSAFACETPDGKTQVYNFYNDQQNGVAITSFGCDESDTVAEELKVRLSTNDSVFSKIVRSASKPFRSDS